MQTLKFKFWSLSLLIILTNAIFSVAYIKNVFGYSAIMTSDEIIDPYINLVSFYVRPGRISVIVSLTAYANEVKNSNYQIGTTEDRITTDSYFTFNRPYTHCRLPENYLSFWNDEYKRITFTLKGKGFRIDSRDMFSFVLIQTDYVIGGVIGGPMKTDGDDAATLAITDPAWFYVRMSAMGWRILFTGTCYIIPSLNYQTQTSWLLYMGTTSNIIEETNRHIPLFTVNWQTLITNYRIYDCTYITSGCAIDSNDYYNSLTIAYQTY